jgi:hypothetical protein
LQGPVEGEAGDTGKASQGPVEGEAGDHDGGRVDQRA